MRTWDVPSGEPRNIFRRGSTTAEITSLQFAYSIQNKCTFQPELLTVASDSGTAHVFQCFDNTNTSSRTSSEKEEGKEEENESNEEKKTKAIETKYASSSSSSSTAQKIVHMGGMVSKMALAGAKIVTKTSSKRAREKFRTQFYTPLEFLQSLRRAFWNRNVQLRL